MKGNIRDYARIGLVHHMLYNDSINDPDDHLKTLAEFLKRDDIETLDCCIPYGEERRKILAEKVRKCQKEVVYALHLFPANKISLASLSFQEQSIAQLIIKDQIDVAAAIGATGIVFVSGADIPDNRIEAKKSFKEFCIWFCNELKQYDITALLEPFDREFDKKFLLGPIVECVEFIDSLQPYVKNIGIELDIAHLPLMGEDLVYAVRTSAKYIKRVHLGNCISKNTSNPLYGDFHPAIGIKDGDIDVDEVAIVLKELLKIKYLNKDNRGALILEMIPLPGKSVEDTIQYSFDKLNDAWKMV